MPLSKESYQSCFFCCLHQHVFLNNHDAPDANTSISVAYINVTLLIVISIVMPVHLFRGPIFYSFWKEISSLAMKVRLRYWGLGIVNHIISIIEISFPVLFCSFHLALSIKYFRVSYDFIYFLLFIAFSHSPYG
jgi:hypothetical protein